MEHSRRDAHVRTHAQAHDGDFAHRIIAAHFRRADAVFQAAEQFQSGLVVAARHGEREIGRTLVAHVLDNHVHVHIGIGHSAQDLIGDAGFVGNAAHVDAGLVFVEGDA